MLIFPAKEGATSRLLSIIGRIEGFDPKKVIEMSTWCQRAAYVYPDEYRSAKGRLMNQTGFTEQSPILDERELLIFNKLTECRDLFGRRSLLYQTLLRATAPVEKDLKTIQREYKESTSPPPAFDPSMTTDYNSVPNRRTRRDIESWLRSNDYFPEMLRKIAKEELEWLSKLEPRYITLNNSTTTSLRYFGIDLTDIMGMTVVPNSFMDKFPKLGKFFKIVNRYCSDDGVLYLPYPEGERITGIGGVHKVIPDKDGKKREIYQMYPWVQVLSKGVHVFLDRIARRLPGNYTYDQKGLLQNIVDKGYNKKGKGFTFVGTDMSKYSDTLQRSFIMMILRTIGIPDDIVEELDILYSLPVYDEIKHMVWKDTNATYQGQYGDFPMITIANIVLQEYFYYYYKIPHQEGLNGAVGDDTCTGAKGKWLEMPYWIQNVYSAVGVRINSDKTSVLYDGEGAIDFVKLQLDGEGILWFLNLKAAKTGNWDKIITDVLESHLDMDSKIRFLKLYFPGVNVDRLLSISKMNGGVSDNPITEVDLAMYTYKMLQIKRVLEPKKDDLQRFIERLQAELNDQMSYLSDTALYGFLTEVDKQSIIDKQLDPEDYLVKRILNIVSIGYTGDKVQNLRYLIGHRPSELDTELKEYEFDLIHSHKEWDRSDYLLTWKQVCDHESWIAFRDKSSYNRLYSGTRLLELSELDLSTQGILDSFNHYHMEYNTLPVSDYKLIDQALREAENNSRMITALNMVGWIRSITCFNTKYYYLSLPKGDKRITYRLYEVSYNSRYDQIPFDVYEERIRPLVRLSYSEFYRHWSYWQENEEDFRRILKRCDIG